MIRRPWLAAVLGAGLLVSGCGAEESAPVSEDALEIDVTITGGSATPTNATFDSKVGEPIVLIVDSDADDELHVHSEPEHSFEVKPGQDQRFEFTVDVPGRVDIELHHLDRTVATITVGA